MDIEENFAHHFEFLYGEEKAKECLQRLRELIDKYEADIQSQDGRWGEWTEKDSILITYGDVIQDLNRPKECRLTILKEFLDKYVGQTITSLHLLPFFPSSSDGGFAVIDYKKVRQDLGDWSDIEALAGKYRLMADLVINHTSWYNQWFQNFREGKEPGKDYFIEMDPTLDLSDQGAGAGADPTRPHPVAPPPPIPWGGPGRGSLYPTKNLRYELSDLLSRRYLETSS